MELTLQNIFYLTVIVVLVVVAVAIGLAIYYLIVTLKQWISFMERLTENLDKLNHLAGNFSQKILSPGAWITIITAVAKCLSLFRRARSRKD